MNFTGVIIGIATFLCIGLFHPLVIKGEYYFGTKIWWVFLLAGIMCLCGAVYIQSVTLSSIVSVIGFSCFWSILELFEQKKRVEKGWFPKNPKRKY